MRFCLFIPGVTDASGKPYVFASHDTAKTPVTSLIMPHSITGVGAMTSTLDPVEAIVDSSSITVSLAIDAGTVPTVGEIFARDPISIGRMTASRLPGATTISFSASSSVTATSICVGVSAYSYTESTYSGGVSTGTVTLATWAQDSYQYYDPDIRLGAEVTRYPQMWKGRLAYLYVTRPHSDTTWCLYRVCALADNPMRTLSEITLTLSPLDARVREAHVSSPLDAVGHFSTSTRAYAATRTKHTFAEAYIGQAASRFPTWTIDHFPCPSGDVLYNTLQPVTTTPSGRSLARRTVLDGISTPTRPPVAVSSWATSPEHAHLVGRSGTTAYLSLTPSSDSRMEILPTARWYITAGDALAQLATRSATRAATPTTSADAEPLVRLTATGTQIADAYVYTVNAYTTSPSVTSTPLPIYFGMQWESSVNEPPEETAPSLTDNTAHVYRRDIGVRDDAWSWETTQGWSDFCASADLYSWKLHEPEILSSRSATRVQSSQNWREASGVVHHCGWLPLQSWSQIQIARARYWWERGEAQLCLDTQFCAVGESLWVNVHWTEDGETFIDKRTKLELNDVPTSGVYRYNVLKSPRCAGVGDWFGYRAAFQPDQRIEAAADSGLLWTYLLDSIRIPSAWVYLTSLYKYTVPLLGVTEYGYDTPSDFAESLPGLLLMSGSCVTFDLQRFSEYLIARKWTGRADKAESYVDINDDDLLSIPTVTRDDHVVSTYQVKLPDDQEITYIDRVAKELYADSDSITIDLSASEIDSLGVVQMRAALQNLVYRLGAERLVYSAAIPWRKGYELAPGDMVRLTSAYSVGVNTTNPPNGVMTRVVGVTQDPVQERTELTLQAVETGAAKYNYGWLVIDCSDDYTKLYLDTVEGLDEGEIIYHSGGSAEIVSIDWDGNYIIVDTPVMVSAIWYSDDYERFVVDEDRLG